MDSLRRVVVVLVFLIKALLFMSLLLCSIDWLSKWLRTMSQRCVLVNVAYVCYEIL